PEVRHAEHAVRAGERALETRAVVEVGLYDLDAHAGQRLALLGAGVARDRPGGELARVVCRDRANEPAALCTGGSDDGDRLFLGHICLLGLGLRGAELIALRELELPRLQALLEGGLGRVVG